MRDDWEFVREVTVAASSSATRGKRVLILCSSGAGAWKVASAFGYHPKAQVERFESELSVFLVLDDDRVRYEFPIGDQE